MHHLYYNSVLLFLLFSILLAWVLYRYRKSWVFFGIEGFSDSGRTESALSRTESSEGGFYQENPFISLQGNLSYDAFYVEIYDLINSSQEHASQFVDWIRANMAPTRDSFFLDAGCGTGAVLQQLVRNGYRAVGIDKSDAMVDYAISVDDNVRNLIVKGDVLDSMQFHSGQFSHILCCGFTLYEWTDEEKLRFLRNSYFWMIAGGYLIVQLVDDVDKFNHRQESRAFPGFSYSVVHKIEGKAVPQELRALGKAVPQELRALDKAVPQELRALDKDLSSKGASGTLDKCDVCSRETFVDNATQHVRENERILHMCSTESIVNMALRSGFVMRGLSSYISSASYTKVYIFERTL